MITIKNYTEDDLKYIVENYNNMTVKELSKKLLKSENSVSNAVRKLGLSKQIHNKWSEKEIDFLKKNYIKMTSEEMSKHIKHSINAINTQRDRLGLVRNAIWTKEEKDFLEKNYMNMSQASIAKVLNKTEGAVRAKCFDLKLYKKELPWEEWEIQYVKDNYMEMLTKDIAKYLNRTTNAVRIRADRMGMKKYPYNCNYHYFDNIDTEEKAYWLGFLTADGWISLSKKSNAGVTGIELQYNDLEHLKKFNKSLNGNYKITDGWKVCPLSKYKDKKNHFCCIRIFSITMYEALTKLGFSNCKTYNATIPKIPSDLLRHYIGGYFDGDGCFTFTNKSFHVNFLTTSCKLNDDLLKTLKNINVFPTSYSYVSKYGTTMYRIEINKIIERLIFLDWIYSDCTIYLNRKFKKYLKVKQKYRTNDCLAV